MCRHSVFSLLMHLPAGVLKSSNTSESSVTFIAWCIFVSDEMFFAFLRMSLQLTDGGKAARAKMSIGDIILSINGISTDSMNHLEAQNKIKACTDHLSLTLQR